MLNPTPRAEKINARLAPDAKLAVLVRRREFWLRWTVQAIHLCWQFKQWRSLSDLRASSAKNPEAA
jgi:hypothetical protein